MNKINRINALNQTELESNTPFDQSWHNDYNDSNYIHINHLHESIKVKDLLIIFSQYGIPTHIKLVNNFAFLKYENWHSCVLAIDNLQGVEVFGNKLVVDHCWFKLKDGEREDDFKINYDEFVPKLKELTGIAKVREDVPESIDEGKEAETEDTERGTTEEESIDQESRKRILDDDELKDPMAEFLNEKSHKSHRGHISSHKSHRSSDRSHDSSHKSHRSHSSHSSHSSHKHKSRHSSHKEENESK